LQYELDAVIDGHAPVDALFHLAICQGCREAVADLRLLHRCAAASPRPHVPDGLRGRIDVALIAERRAFRRV
jgi:hypothetical protein